MRKWRTVRACDSESAELVPLPAFNFPSSLDDSVNSGHNIGFETVEKIKDRFHMDGSESFTDAMASMDGMTLEDLVDDLNIEHRTAPKVLATVRLTRANVALTAQNEALRAQNEALKAKVEAQQQQIDALTASVAAMEARLAALEAQNMNLHAKLGRLQTAVLAAVESSKL